MNKLNLNEQEIINLYDNGLTLINLSKIYNCSSWAIRERLMNNSIKLRNCGIKKEPLVFNKEQEQILLGSLLGDGCIYIANKGTIYNHFKFSEEHSLKQKDYLLWKNSYLNFNKPNFREKNINNIKYNSTFLNKTNFMFKQYFNLFYSNNKKVVTKEILDKLEPLGIAVWFMDDGSYNYYCKSIEIATHCFGLEGNQIIQQYFKEKWDIDCKIQNKLQKRNGFLKIERIYCQLKFNKKDAKKFVEIIKPYILQIPSMTYKIGLDEERKINAVNNIKERRLKSKDEHKRYMKEYHLRNEDRELNYRKNYYQLNKERFRQNYLKNKERLK